MSDEDTGPQHHSLRERLDAAQAAAEEVVAEESGEVNKLAIPFEELAAAVHAAIHPDELAEHEVAGAVDPMDEPAAEDHPAGGKPAAP
ncbi:MAG: hypothetical protein ACHQ06_05730 [Candidatus Dormibacteria bacterium]|jgi:hypothetical protein